MSRLAFVLAAAALCAAMFASGYLTASIRCWEEREMQRIHQRAVRR